MRLPTRILFSKPTLGACPDSPSQAPPPPYSPSHSRHQLSPPPSPTRHGDPSARPARDTQMGVEEQDIGVSVITTPQGQTTMVVEDPNLLAMFLEDYRRTKEYIRELEWRVAVRKALRRYLYSTSHVLSPRWCSALFRRLWY